MCFLITFDILNIMLFSHTIKKDKGDALAFARATLLVIYKGDGLCCALLALATVDDTFWPIVYHHVVLYIEPSLCVSL
jgi:hypothetical protein